MELQDMIDRLKEVSDEAWGHYILKRDILYNKIKSEEKEELIFESIKCGTEYAKKISSEHTSSSVEKMALDMGLKITERETKPGTKRLTFATFTTPNHITIMTSPLRRISSEIKKLRLEDREIFGNSQIRSLLLAHELFHFVEEQNKSEIYTRNRKIKLWSLFGFKNTSTLRSLSEIAGMYFAKELTNFPYCPLMLDVILFYPFDRDTSVGLLRQIVAIDEQIKKGEIV